MRAVTLSCVPPTGTAWYREAALLLVALACINQAPAQPSTELSEDTQYLSYQRVPTWSAVVSDWKSDTPQLHVYDYDQYPGHAEFVSRGLRTGISFSQFTQQVRDPAERNYVPLFLFDLRSSPIELDGETYLWAARMEDYSYEDTPDEMAGTVAKLNRLLVAYLRTQSVEDASVLIVLSVNPGFQPNFGIEDTLRTQGIRGISLPDLLSAVGSPRIEILNPVTAVGRLRYVGAAEMESARYSPTDIVVFEELPTRVPPVSGIITLAPQTPLSHVNLLARNRGTLNLYALTLADLPGAEEQLGELVRISIEQNSLAISPVTLAGAEAHWATHRPPAVAIPEPDLEIVRIVNLAESGASVASAAIGAKASNYALLQKELPEYVRPGHALPISWYFEVAQDTRFQLLQGALLERKQNMTPEEIETVLADMRDALNAHAIDPARQQELRELIATHYPDTRIRLRSSTNCEDLPEFNGAGLYESKGFNTNDDESELWDDLLEVYASLWTPHAFAEREFYGIDHRLAGMGVLINEAFPDEHANGVVLTIPGADDFSVLINSQPGEAAVTNPEPGQVPESILFEASASDRFEVQTESSIGPVFTVAGMETLLIELKTVSVRIHEILTRDIPAADRPGYGVDIEFKLEREGARLALYVKQGRLLGTALPD